VDRTKGIIITVLGVLFLIPDSLLVRLITATPLAICFWRGLLGGSLLLIIYLIYGLLSKDNKRLDFTLKEILIILCIALSTICFVLSVNYTTVANTLFLLSTAPFFSIFLSYFLLGEKIRLKDLCASLIALIGVFIISLGSQVSNNTLATSLGDLFGIGIAIFTALVLTLARHGSSKLVIRSNAIGMYAVALFVLPFVKNFSVEQETILYLLILCLICVPIGSLLILTGPKYISASEVSLIILLQVIIAPILAWLILKEYPGLSSLVGGIFVISALLIVNLKGFSRS
jgi:drug/metabolite transporter (DMT)-like permease|tara:strand:+ start:148 stop:1008 length:861 start_codon:yes stop_codon:yes gene_type:complete